MRLSCDNLHLSVAIWMVVPGSHLRGVVLGKDIFHTQKPVLLARGGAGHAGGRRRVDRPGDGRFTL